MMADSDTPSGDDVTAEGDAGFLFVVAYVGGPMDGQSEVKIAAGDDDLTAASDGERYVAVPRVFDAAEHELERDSIAKTGATNVYDFRVMRWVAKHT